ncbi:MAG: hypothetical protein ACREL9_07595 [Gemmatimonadales bacterium]
MRLMGAAALVALVACAVHVPHPALHEAREVPTLDSVAAPLKVHARAGTVYQLAQWRFDAADSVLAGAGTRYAIDRRPLESGEFRIPLDSIALVETSGTETLHPAGKSVLAMMTTVWGAVTIACAVDPKACFGSCPTFYVDAVSATRPRAEGFSASIARALEATDVDALDLVQPGGGRVTIRMANEAWETHAVRQVQLLAIPVRRAEEVFATSGGRFHAVEQLLPPARCMASGEDCRAAVSMRDSLEWRPFTDSTDLAAPDTIELAFVAPGGTEGLGLVLGARQSFVSTFLLYQTMAYLGHEAGAWLAALERGDPIARRAHEAVSQALGRIAVAIADSAAGWRTVGSFDEAGPIATDVQLIPLPLGRPVPAGDTVRVRLVMARGSWRVGYAALAAVGAERAAITLEAIQVRGPDPEAGERLRGGRGYLFTVPGDEYLLTYALPRDAGTYALYIKSRGYYYEWMRGEWLSEEDPHMVALLSLSPRDALRKLAPKFKSVEAGFERHFWASRFGR